MMRRAILFIGVLCMAGCPKSESPADVAAARAFFAQPLKAQMKTFRNHSVEEQLALYYFGNQVRHPPAMYLAQCFALNDAAGVELLRSRLTRKNSDLDVRDISMLLEWTHSMGRYNVAGDVELMKALRQQIGSMRDGGGRDMAELNLRAIENSPIRAAEGASACEP